MKEWGERKRKGELKRGVKNTIVSSFISAQMSHCSMSYEYIHQGLQEFCPVTDNVNEICDKSYKIISPTPMYYTFLLVIKSSVPAAEGKTLVGGSHLHSRPMNFLVLPCLSQKYQEKVNCWIILQDNFHVLSYHKFRQCHSLVLTFAPSTTEIKPRAFHIMYQFSACFNCPIRQKIETGILINK